MDEGKKELSKASFYMTKEVSTWFYKQYEAKNAEGLRLNLSVGDDFSFEIIDQPFHLTMKGKEEGILFYVHIRNIMIVSYEEDTADLSVFFYANGDDPTVKTSGRIQGDVTKSFFRYLKIGVQLKCYIVEHDLFEQVSGLDTGKEGILVEQQGESIILKRVKGKERPDLACVGFTSGIQMLRPYSDEAINAVFAETTSFEETLKMAKDGDADAMGEVAAAYFNGDGVEHDIEKAVYWFRKLAETGSAVGQFNMGIQCLKGEGTEQNFEQALYWMQEAEKNGDPDAPGYVQQLTRIVELQKKADSGDVQAMADLASLLMATGRAVGEENEASFYEKSIALATAAEKKNNPTAHYILALAYENGRGVEKNTEKAIEHYKLGAQLGNVECKQNLGCCYLEGDSVPVDKEKGFALCMEAAKLGFGPAMRTVGRCYQFGNGVKESMKQAIFWYEKALELIDDPELAQKVAIFKTLPDFNDEHITKETDNSKAGKASITENSGETLEEDIIQWFREKDTLISEKDILDHFSGHGEAEIGSALKKLLKKGILFGGPGVIFNDLYGLDDSKSPLKTAKLAAPAENKKASSTETRNSKSQPSKSKMDKKKYSSELVFPDSNRLDLGCYSLIIPEGFSVKRNVDGRAFWAWLPNKSDPNDRINAPIMLMEGRFMPDPDDTPVQEWINNGINGMRVISKLTGMGISEPEEFHNGDVHGFVAAMDDDNFIGTIKLPDGGQQIRVTAVLKKYQGEYAKNLLLEVLKTVQIKGKQKRTTPSNDAAVQKEKADDCLRQANNLEQDANNFRAEWEKSWQQSIDELKQGMANKTYMSEAEVEKDMRAIISEQKRFGDNYNKLIIQMDSLGKKLLDMGADGRTVEVINRMIQKTIDDSHDMDLDFGMSGMSNAHIGDAKFQVSAQALRIQNEWRKRLNSSSVTPASSISNAQKQTNYADLRKNENERRHNENERKLDSVFSFLERNPGATCAMVAENLGVTLHESTALLTKLISKGRAEKKYKGKTPVYYAVKQYSEQELKEIRGKIVNHLNLADQPCMLKELTDHLGVPEAIISELLKELVDKKEIFILDQGSNEPKYTSQASLDRAEKRKEQEEEAQKKLLYYEAAALAASSNSKDIRAAISKFESLTGYKDAEEQIEKCRKNLETVLKEENQRAEEEAAQIARDKAAAEEAERKRKTKKRKGIIAIVIVLIIGALALVAYEYYNKKVIPANAYRKADILFFEGKYEEAEKAYLSLGDYLDASQRAKKAREAMQTTSNDSEQIISNPKLKQESSAFENNETTQEQDSKQEPEEPNEEKKELEGQKEPLTGNDTAPPTVNSIKLSTIEVSAPGAITVTVSLEDDITGVNTANVEFYNEETDTDLYCNLKLESSGDWVGTINVDSYSNSGEYKLCYINPRDNVGNQMYYSGDGYHYGNEHINLPANIASVSFVVLNDMPQDTAPPTVKSIKLSTNEVSAPGAITVTVSLEDDITGVNTANVEFYNEETDSDIYCSLKLESSGDWVGTINVDSYANSGEYKLCFINPRDNVGNQMYYSGDGYHYGNEHINLPANIASVSFVVLNDMPQDTAPPTVNSIKLSTNEVSAPGAITVMVSLEDDITGVNTANVEFYNEETDTDLYCSLKLESSGDWVGTINVDSYSNSGEYKLCYINPRDNVGNQMYYSGDGYHYGNEHINLPADIASVSFIVR